MKICEITDIIEKVAPKNTAFDFDNVGLLVGDGGNECTGVLVTVDVTYEAMTAAKKMGANLIIAHHPVIFTPIKCLIPSDYLSDIITDAYSSGISIYAAHTNMDCSSDNMAVRLLKVLGARNISPLFANGLGAVGNIEETTLNGLQDKVAAVLQDNRTFTVGNGSDKVRRVAVVNGGGADSETIAAARSAGADVFVSGDIKHHILLMAKESGIKLLSVGHYASEKCFNDIVYDILQCHIDTTIDKYYEGNPYN